MSDLEVINLNFKVRYVRKFTIYNRPKQWCIFISISCIHISSLAYQIFQNAFTTFFDKQTGIIEKLLETIFWHVICEKFVLVLKKKNTICMSGRKEWCIPILIYEINQFGLGFNNNLHHVLFVCKR